MLDAANQPDATQVTKDRRQLPPSQPRLTGPRAVDVVAGTAEQPVRSRTGRQIAIALSDRPTSTDGSPTVVAKGYGEMAEKILRLAFDNDVKVRHDPELAQILETVELDCEIPLEAFAAVAEILSYVYAANRRLADAGDAGQDGDGGRAADRTDIDHAKAEAKADTGILDG